MKPSKIITWLMIGDCVLLVITSVVGFLTHDQAIDWRLLTTYLPYQVAWLMIAPWLGVYRPTDSADSRQIWRPILAAFLAAPMAAWLRGVWINRPILPIFVLVLGLSAAFGFGIWRYIWTRIYHQIELHDG